MSKIAAQMLQDASALASIKLSVDAGSLTGAPQPSNPGIQSGTAALPPMPKPSITTPTTPTVPTQTTIPGNSHMAFTGVLG